MLGKPKTPVSSPESWGFKASEESSSPTSGLVSLTLIGPKLRNYETTVTCPHQVLTLWSQSLSRDSSLEAFVSKSVGEEATHYLATAPLPIWCLPGSLSNFYPNGQQYQLLVTGKKMGGHRLHLEQRTASRLTRGLGSAQTVDTVGLTVLLGLSKIVFPKFHRKIS